jgi:hypothetical protein
MHDLAWGVAAVGVIFVVAGVPLILLADRLDDPRNPTFQRIVPWAIGALGLLLLAIPALLIVANLFSPLFVLLWGLVANDPLPGVRVSTP